MHRIDLAMEKFHGSAVALITPFANGKVDEKAYADFINWHIEQGTHCLVPVGTTGESPTVTHEEHRRCIDICIEVTAGRVPVIAGAGSNSTQEAIELAQFAQQAGADAAMCVVPYYNKPNQRGLYAHFKAIHDATDLPILIYSVPGRVVSCPTVETLAALAKLPRILGIKDATADLSLPEQQRAACGDDFLQLSGEDATVVPYLAAGGHGCISVTANIAPKLCSELHEAWKAGDLAKVDTINRSLMPLHKALFADTSPAPVKYAATRLGLCGPELRLPMVEASDESKEAVDLALQHAGLI